MELGGHRYSASFAEFVSAAARGATNLTATVEIANLTANTARADTAQFPTSFHADYDESGGGPIR